MLVRVSEEMQAYIERKMREGDFLTAEEAVDAAVQRMAEEDQRLVELKAALQIGIDQLDRGEKVLLTPKLAAEIFAEGKRRHEAGQSPKRDVIP